MGELIIHIDQKSGAVLRVEQKLDDAQKEALLSDQKTFSREQIDHGIVTLRPRGNLYHGSPSKILRLKEHRDGFQRIVALPVELWEKEGNTICSINCGGVIYRCFH